MHVRYPLKRGALVAAVIASVSLAGCADGSSSDTGVAPESSATISPHPDESLLRAKAVAYDSAEELRTAFEESSYECSEWSEMDVEGTEDAGTCSDGKDQFLVFEDEAALTSYRDELSAMDDADPARYLFGPNWSAHASEGALHVVRNHIGGQLGW